MTARERSAPRALGRAPARPNRARRSAPDAPRRPSFAAARPRRGATARGRRDGRARHRRGRGGRRRDALSSAPGDSPRRPMVVASAQLRPRIPARARALALRALGAGRAGRHRCIVIEGYQGSVLESPQVMRDVIDEVGSPALGANLDYVNFLTPPTVARFPEALARRWSRRSASHLRSIHVKDARVWPRLSSHVEECAAGTGVLDLALVVELARSARARRSSSTCGRRGRSRRLPISEASPRGVH